MNKFGLIIQLGQHGYTTEYPMTFWFVTWHVNEANEITRVSSSCQYTSVRNKQTKKQEDDEQKVFL